MEKLDVHGIRRRYEIALDTFRKDKTVLPENKELVLRFLEDAEIGKTIKNMTCPH